MKKKLFLVAVGLLLLAGVVVGVEAQTTPQVYLAPVSLTLAQVGDTGSVEVLLNNVPESAGFQLKLSFNKEVIQVDAVDLLTPPAGATSIPLKDIKNEEGVVTFGALVTCGGGVCPNILSGEPAVLATLTVSAVGEVTTNLEFDASYILYGTEMGADDLPVRIEAALAGGQVVVGETQGPTINLSPGGNSVVWPGGLADFTSLSALESIQADCGSAPAISRRKNGWWESVVFGYGGVGFALSEGDAAYIRVASGCVWSP